MENFFARSFLFAYCFMVFSFTFLKLLQQCYLQFEMIQVAI